MIRVRLEREALLAHARALRDALNAKEELLACYRVGKRPSEALWKRLEKARQAVELFDTEVAECGAELRALVARKEPR
jgi:hypothetical protein